MLSQSGLVGSPTLQSTFGGHAGDYMGDGERSVLPAVVILLADGHCWISPIEKNVKIFTALIPAVDWWIEELMVKVLKVKQTAKT